MHPTRLVTRGISLALLLACALSAVALTVTHAAGTRAAVGARAVGIAAPSRHAQVQAAIASGTLLFVGASYTVGLGATAPAAGYAPVLASRLDRRYRVSAVSGTGFLNPGSRHQGTFGERIARLPPTVDPRIVVLQGGRNDVGYPRPALLSAVRDTVTLARHRFVHAQVVVMGPIPATVPVGAALMATRDIVRAGAQQTGAGFVDPIGQGWITGDNQRRYAGPVPAHPNDAGYVYIAGRLLADLPTALAQSKAPLGGDLSATATPPPADVPVGTAPGRAGVPVAADGTPRPGL